MNNYELICDSKKSILVFSNLSLCLDYVRKFISSNNYKSVQLFQSGDLVYECKIPLTNKTFAKNYMQ